MPKRRLKMLVYREVLRLHFELGKSYRTIAEICGLSVGGVHNILERFAANGLTWPVPAEWDEVTLKRQLYPAAPREAVGPGGTGAGVPQSPGYRRWTGLRGQAHGLLQTVTTEMAAYVAARSGR